MIKDLEEKQRAWNLVSDEIIIDVKAGNNVGFVTLGDASVYSTYTYLLNIIGDQIPVETIAGIASYTQIAAQLSIPLMIDEEMLEVLPATAPMDKISAAIDVNDNIVIMKISAHSKAIYDLIKDKNLLDKAVLVQGASMAEEKITPFNQIDPAAKLPYFSTLLVKKNFVF
ncbi:precorrin-2 C(20)-methyltransferase [Lentilactobacillus kosonis]|uniref:Cobalt-precorrin-2 C20-methyltransferase n=1 Tax=Lentilactobacillus kosonis TaxID=2810561 RepID=A0A401FN53_9LACO|nr:cobalt-precorrin-2 C20-methyltransferase [Lentilactobacillus kosonis]